MELEQKYIEDNITCRFEEWFIEGLLDLDYDLGVEIMVKISKTHDNLPQKNDWPQLVAGVIKGDVPYFFELEYVKEHELPATFLDIIEIDCDKYLDYINDKNYLK